MDCRPQAPLSAKFSRQEHWSGLPFHSPGRNIHSAHVELKLKTAKLKQTVWPPPFWSSLTTVGLHGPHLGCCSEKAMAPHSSTLVWKIPSTEESGRLLSMGSQRVGHNWATSLSLFIFIHWRRKWQPTPAFLPGESQGRRSLVGCRLWGRTELDTPEAT